MKSDNRKSVTIKDVAKEANVSYATVSRALSGSPVIKDETRRRVLEVCHKLGYTTNYVARSMVMRETHLIGVVLPSIDNPFMSELAYHLECGARNHGYAVMLCNSNYSYAEEEKAFTLLLGQQVDGIVIVPIGRDSYRTLKKYLSKTPTVFVNENLMDAPESYVTVDNFQGARIATEHLLALGHRDIMYFGRLATSATHTFRAMGCQSVCDEHGIQPQFFDSDSDATTIQIGYHMAKELFQTRNNFTAIQASTDTLALGVLEAAEELSIRIPEDISLIGFDNIRYAGLPKINLTTIEQPKGAMASTAVDILLEKIHSDYDSYAHRILSPALVERKSCLPRR